MPELPEAVDAEVQNFLGKWRDEDKLPLPLTQDQRDWLVRAIQIYQAHEKQMKFSASTHDKICTEAMVRYITESFSQGFAGGTTT